MPNYNPTKVLEILKNNPTLPLDTVFFDQEFKNQILSEIDNLDQQTNGLLIKSENWQALNLLKEKYRGKVKCIYIDPPYNTGSDGFLYKDSFKHSSWLSFMENRLKLAKEFLSEDGVIFVSIDDNEVVKLKELMDGVFGVENFVAQLIFQSNSIKNNAKQISTSHEYCLTYVKNLIIQSNWRITLPNSKKLLDYFKSLPSNITSLEKSQLIKSFIRQNNISGSLANYTLIDDSGLFRLDNIGGVKNGNTKTEIIHPVTKKPCKISNGGWRFNEDKINQLLKDGVIYFGSNENSVPQIKRYLQEDHEAVFNSVIYKDTSQDAKQVANLSNGNSFFNFPKNLDYIKSLTSLVNNINSNNLILDFFAGSGTTGHAVINLNREDDGNRKFMLVEMGEYFDTVLKPRIAKVIYTENWKEGKPNGEIKGSSQIVKYLTLEQYEDVLDNLETKMEDLDDGLPFKYWYTPESLALDNSLNLKTPFANKTKIGKGQIEMKVDLAETYNYLRGLEVKKVKVFEFEGWQYKAYQVARNGIFDTLIVWRNIDEKLASIVENNQDIENLKKVLAEFSEVDTMEVNFDVLNLASDKENRLEVNGRIVEVRRIKRNAFEI